MEGIFFQNDILKQYIYILLIKEYNIMGGVERMAQHPIISFTTSYTDNVTTYG